MYRVTIDNMDLRQIAESGQCFRWKKLEQQENTYNVVAFGRSLDITQEENEFVLSCDENEWNEIWRDYFDLETDYKGIAEKIHTSEDEHLKLAYSKGSGVRILKQDLWEIIVTFMISQNNNIPRIRKSVELLCERAQVKTLDGKGYAFPGPGQVPAEVFEDKTMGFGYRAGYLKEIYAYAEENPKWLDSFRNLGYDEAMNCLLERKGIGKKVANCICLFGLHHVEAFPIDTHVKQFLQEYYSDGFDFERYEGVAGIIQQYLFYYELIKGR